MLAKIKAPFQIDGGDVYQKGERVEIPDALLEHPYLDTLMADGRVELLLDDAPAPAPKATRKAKA